MVLSVVFNNMSHFVANMSHSKGKNDKCSNNEFTLLKDHLGEVRLLESSSLVSALTSDQEEDTGEEGEHCHVLDGIVEVKLVSANEH